MSAHDDLLPPRYRSPERIGHGGMGDIYRARDTVLDRDVAVKVLAERYSEDVDIRSRFKREALAAARLSGEPNTVTIFDVGEHNGRPFIVMEYLPGGSLEDRLRDGPPPAADALRWLEQAAHALDAANRRGIVHRDVKPGNLLLSSQGNVHVADFGIASAAGLASLTMSGTVLGTAGYLSPEQAAGERATAASDRYAFGVVAYELLAGDRPFRSESPTAEASAHVNAPVPSLCKRRPDLDCPELDPVFERALAKEPDDRYASCAELVGDLRHALARSASSTRIIPSVAAPPPGRPSEPPRRRSWLVPAALLLLLLGGGAAAATVALSRNDGEKQAEARTITQEITTTIQGKPEISTTTTTVPAPAPPPPPPADDDDEQPVADGTGRELTDQATDLMNQGRFAEAVPVARRAVDALGGSGELYEGYALYNLGRSLIETGNCGEGVGYLDRSEAIQGKRKEIDRARKKCR